ncbi:hypothetical protein F0562_007443 [Nyssa sinensis]|uniref:Uncharacterized protein n=1 Tax=Nyssa sinensis TaxID=561372 RepID=A0A5J5A6G2_9ASTE|nr:hypothetical protein F0562_007443 [Nyssa sinensis]
MRKATKKKKEKEAKLAEIELNLLEQLREIVLSPQPVNVERLEWRQLGDLTEFAAEVLRRLKEMNNEEVSQLGFDDEPRTHFNRLPVRT